MAVLRMKPFFLVGVLEKRKPILEAIQKLECAQVEENARLKKINPQRTISTINSMIEESDQAIQVIEKYSHQKGGFFESTQFESPRELNLNIAKSETLYKKVRYILNLATEIEKFRNEISQLENESLLLYYYLNLDLPVDITDTKHTRILVGSLPNFWNEEALCGKLGCDVYFEILDANKLQTTIFLIIPSVIFEKIQKILTDISFSQPPFASTEKTPEEKDSENEKKIKDLNQKISEYEEKIKNMWSDCENIKRFSDYLRLRKEKYETICKLGLTNHTFILEGFLNPKFENTIKNKLAKKFGAYIEISEPDENSPVDFSNNFFSAPVENITQTYSMPSYYDVDPNPIMALFYYVFFGMMFSDAGYGLVLAIACGWLAFFKKFEQSKKNLFRMFFFCGVSTTFWGFMYGSFFGNAIDTVAAVFFGSDFSLAPLWINTVTEPLTLLIFSIILGLIQIVVGLSIKFYILFRRRKFMEAIATVFNWMLILIGIGISSIGALSKIDFISTIGVFVAILGVLLVVTLGGYKNKGIMRILGGIISLYDITSYISDALSYSRLMALGIATGVIANVINMLGSMAGGGIFGFFIFVVVSILGHATNFGINILGAYVHTNRLQYVEFFSKFYDGGGKKFTPFGMHTKYIKFFNKVK